MMNLKEDKVIGGSFYRTPPCGHHTCDCATALNTIETGVHILSCNGRRLPITMISIVLASGMPHYLPLKDGRTPIPRKRGEKIFTMPIYRTDQPALAPEVKKYVESKVADHSTSFKKRSGRHLAHGLEDAEESSSDLINKIEHFARAESTVAEISNLLGLEIMDIIDISRTNGIYVHDGSREKEWVSAIITLAAQGKSIDEIFFESEIPRQSIRSLAQRVVSGGGNGAQILMGLITAEGLDQDSKDGHLELENTLLHKEETMAEISVAQDSQVTKIGRKVKVLSGAPDANPILAGRQDQDATIMSALDHVFSIRFDDGDVALARYEEVRLLVGDTEWRVGEEVMFKLNDGIAVGVIESLISNYQNTGVRYVVSIEGVQDIISPNEFIQ